MCGRTNAFQADPTDIRAKITSLLYAPWFFRTWCTLSPISRHGIKQYTVSEVSLGLGLLCKNMTGWSLRIVQHQAESSQTNLDTLVLSKHRKSSNSNHLLWKNEYLRQYSRLYTQASEAIVKWVGHHLSPVLCEMTSFITTKRYGESNKWRHKTEKQPHKVQGNHHNHPTSAKPSKLAPS